MSFLERAQRLIPGERVLAAAQGQTGVYPLLWWLPGGEFLTLFNKRRIVAVTDRSIIVLKAGQFRWNWARPSRVLFSVPRTTPVGPAHRGWNRVALGPENIWMTRNGMGYLERALAQHPAAPPPAPAPAPTGTAPEPAQ